MTILQIVGILVVCVGFVLLYRQRSFHNERVILEHRFYEIQALCTNADATIRLVGIAELRDIIQRPFPGNSQRIHWENYPFFWRGYRLFSIIMETEVEEEVMSSLERAFISLVEFARRSGNTHLNDSLADALGDLRTKLMVGQKRSIAKYQVFRSEPQNEDIVQIISEIIPRKTWNIAEMCASQTYREEVEKLKRTKILNLHDMGKKKTDFELLRAVQIASNRYETVQKAYLYAAKFQVYSRA